MYVLSAFYSGSFSFRRKKNKGTDKEAQWKTYINKDDKRKIELNRENHLWKE
jgi:hypothetical protein